MLSGGDNPVAGQFAAPADWASSTRRAGAARAGCEGMRENHQVLRLAAILAQLPPEVGKEVLASLNAGGGILRGG